MKQHCSLVCSNGLRSARGGAEGEIEGSGVGRESGYPGGCVAAAYLPFPLPFRMQKHRHAVDEAAGPRVRLLSTACHRICAY